MPADERHRADAVFEGGGVKGIAFAGAVAAAERDAGVEEWVNLAGTSAGSIVAALLVTGYDSTGIQKLLADAKYARFADTGPGGKWVGGLWNAAVRLRGMAPGRERRGRERIVRAFTVTSSPMRPSPRVNAWCRVPLR